MSSRQQKNQGSSRRRQLAEQRAAAERRSRRNRILIVLGAVVGVAAVTIAVIFGINTYSRPDPTAADGTGLGAETGPPWPLPADPAQRAKAAGLPIGPMGTAEHYHAHLDVIVNGRPAAVPADIGVDPRSGQMSALHTHTPDGIVHVEAARVGEPFTLGQLFTEWNVALTPDRIGSLPATDKQPLAVYVNGEKYSGNPATLRLQDQQQIAVTYGPIEPDDIPAGYDFSAV